MHKHRHTEGANLKVIVILRCSYSFVKIFVAHKAPWTHSVWTDIYFYKLFLSVVSNWLRHRHDTFVSASFLKYIDSVLNAVKYSGFSSSHVITQANIFYQRIINLTDYKHMYSWIGTPGSKWSQVHNPWLLEKLYYSKLIKFSAMTFVASLE